MKVRYRPGAVIGQLQKNPRWAWLYRVSKNRLPHIFAQIFENPQINLIKKQVSQLLDGD